MTMIAMHIIKAIMYMLGVWLAVVVWSVFANTVKGVNSIKHTVLNDMS